MSNGKYVAYYRVSTDKQGATGLGIEAQRDSVLAYLNGCSPLAEFVEVESGKGANALFRRQQLALALDECRKKKAVLIIAKLDRLARNVHFVSGLIESGVEFVAADMPHASKAMIQMHAVMAEWERDQISDRTKKALQKAKANGKKLGSPNPRNGSAAGCDVIRRHAAEHRARVLPVIESLQSAGLKTMRELADGLEKRGVTTARGNIKWSAGQVHNLIRRAG